jgi:hypothetical protein
MDKAEKVEEHVTVSIPKSVAPALIALMRACDFDEMDSVQLSEEFGVQGLVEAQSWYGKIKRQLEDG